VQWMQSKARRVAIEERIGQHDRSQPQTLARRLITI
jgi:hypothetical protein